MEPITLTFQPGLSWTLHAYWQRNFASKTATCTTLLNIFGVVSTTLLLWLIYRLIHPEKLMLWSSDAASNWLFAGIILGIYGLWELLRLFFAPLLHFHPGEFIGVDIDIDNQFTSHIETKGNSTSRSRTFTADWQDLAELKVTKKAILFCFLSNTNGYQTIIIPKDSITDTQLKEIRYAQPHVASFKHIMQWHLGQLTRNQLLLDMVSILVTVILADWVFL